MVGYVDPGYEKGSSAAMSSFGNPFSGEFSDCSLSDRNLIILILVIFPEHFIPICSQHSELSCTQTNKWINKQLQLHYPLTLLGIISFNKQSDCHIMTVNMNQPRSSWILMTKYRLESRTCSIAAHGYPSSGHCANSSPATHHAQQLTHQTLHSMWTQQSNNTHHSPSFSHNSSCRLTLTTTY